MAARYIVAWPMVKVVIDRKVSLLAKGAPVPAAVDPEVLERFVARGMVMEVQPVEVPEDQADEQESDQVPSDEEPARDFAAMNLDQLRAYAAEHSVDLGGATRKDDIIAVLTAA